MNNTPIKKAVAETTDVPTAVSPNRYYGIDSGHCRGFITQRAYRGREYIVLCAEGVTFANYWSFSNSSLAALLNELIESKFTVYEFDTAAKLFAWLANNPD